MHEHEEEIIDLQEKRRVVTLITLIIVLLVSVLAAALIYVKAYQPQRQVKQEAISIAKKEAKLTNVTDFYTLNREKTTFTVAGNHAEKGAVFALIPKDGAAFMLVEQNQGLTEQAVKEYIWDTYSDEKLIKVNLGLVKDQPTWEAVTKTNEGALNYYLIDFKSGKEISQITEM